MGLQGDKATHDFLSLYSAAKDSALPLLPPESKPPPPSHQGFFLKTHDFLQPLERPSSQSPPPLPSRPAAEKQLRQHALPGGIGTFSISRAAAAAADQPGAAVKQEQPPFAVWGQPDPRGHPWSLPFAARCVAVASARPQPQQQPQRQPERKAGGGFMDAGSRSSGGAGFDDDDGLAARREVSSSLKELSVRVETKGGSCSGSAGTDQLPNTPRSKHSATEQRRRSKINDRFQILREILPQNDQKRDKASFLLEVIEYIRFLQEKVQKYEVSHPEWNQENAKIMPWSNIYFRSSWKNSQNKDEINGDMVSSDPTQVTKNGSSPRFPFAAKTEDHNNAGAFETAPGAQELAELKGCVPFKQAETPNNVTNTVASQQQAQLTNSSPSDDSAVPNGMLNNPELAIDEGTISLSSQYSQGLLTTLNLALQNSGVDLSQASISVQINLGKRATKRSAPVSNSTSKDLINQASRDQEIGHQLRSGDGAREHTQATKRHKSDR
ncbi:hypothetical protein SETIT_6G192000v2 [Setaria italica]|uniref:BHLH domain-containing protein n=1 Tax=Setaria italica TaxID=4555 RepID=K3YHA4_SETIT|nr:transcription factor BIM1 [Setaria italica]RCV31614.1 hypothetical protein SETIT_6G192000v2 [Setaria italica]